MITIAPHMAIKVARALSHANNVYELSDIERALFSGDMQSHVYRETMAITQIQVWPRRKAVHILFVIGNLEDSMVLEGQIHEWARHVDADLITAVGREGWWDHRLPGWKKQGALYSKDIYNGRRYTGTDAANQ
jgi:hypothetical protein